MPHFTYSTSQDGLAVGVLVGLSRASVRAMRTLRQPVPAAVPVRAIIDTGTDTSSIGEAAVLSLGLVPVDTVLVNTASGMAVVNRYEIDPTITAPTGSHSPNLVRRNMLVLGMAHPPVGFDVLIGLDVLAECLFLFDGRAGQFTIGF